MKKYIRKNEYEIQCIVFAILWLGGCVFLAFYIGGDVGLVIDIKNNSMHPDGKEGSLWGTLFLFPGIMPLGPILTFNVFPSWNLRRRHRKGLDMSTEDHNMSFSEIMKETSKRINDQTLEL